MSDITKLVRMKPITSLNVIGTSNGKFIYAGCVPAEIGYIDPTPEKLEAAKFGARFGPKIRAFNTEQEAIDYAKIHGFEINNTLAEGAVKNG